MKNKKRKIFYELRKIAAAHGGVLHAEHVVERARSPRSPLHLCFEWDDTVAGALYRLQQAGRLIRMTIKVIKIEGKPRSVRFFVSLTPERKKRGGGYYEIPDVLAHKELRLQMLHDALEELNLFRERYGALKELTEVFKAIRSVREQLREE